MVVSVVFMVVMVTVFKKLYTTSILVDLLSSSIPREGKGKEGKGKEGKGREGDINPESSCNGVVTVPVLGPLQCPRDEGISSVSCLYITLLL